jgi:hypothetical protein
VTREGEEASLLAACAKWPHPGRCSSSCASSAALRRRRRAGRRGRLQPLAAQHLARCAAAAAATDDVWLGDSMREMPAWYALADAPCSAAALCRSAGQNLIEAAACGCPVVMGPHTFNFADAAELALAAGAAIRVATIEEGHSRRAGAWARVKSGGGGALPAWRSRRSIAAPPRAWPKRSWSGCRRLNPAPRRARLSRAAAAAA